MTMIKCIVMSLDDYTTIISHLKSARIDLFKLNPSYFQSEVDRHLYEIEQLLTKGIEMGAGGGTE